MSDDLIIWEWVFLVVLVSRGCSCQFQVSSIRVVKFYGNCKTGGVSFLVVQWLGLHAFTSSTQVQSLIGELRSCKLWGAAGEKKERTLSCFPGQCDHECDEVILGRCQKHWWMFSLAVSRCQNTELPACWCLQGVPQKESKVFVSWSATSVFLLLLLLFKLWRRNGLSLSEFGAICAPGESECPEDGSRSLCRLWWAL